MIKVDECKLVCFGYVVVVVVVVVFVIDQQKLNETYIFLELYY